MDLDGRGQREELGGVEGGETLIRIYYVRKKSLLSTKGKQENYVLCQVVLINKYFVLISHTHINS